MIEVWHSVFIMHNPGVLQEIIRKNLIAARKSAKMEQRELGLAVGFKEDTAQSRISQYETGERSPGKAMLDRLAGALGIGVEQLTGRMENVELSYRRKGRDVPLISWVQAGHLHEPSDILAVGQSEGEPVGSSTTDPSAFALRIIGQSMEPLFHEGDIVIVSPAVEPQNGDYCIARIGDEVTFKQIFYTLTGYVLKPLNPDYQAITLKRDNGVDFHVIGKVVEKVTRF